MELQIQRQTHSFFTDIKHTVQYDTWEQFLQNEPILKKIWNEFSPFSWSFHPNSNSILQIAWISMQEFSGDLPTSSPIRKLQSYLEIRVIWFFHQA